MVGDLLSLGERFSCQESEDMIFFLRLKVKVARIQRLNGLLCYDPWKFLSHNFVVAAVIGL